MARRKLVLKGRGMWSVRKPLIFEIIGPKTDPYLWIGQLHDEDDERYLASLSPAMARRLAGFLSEIADDPSPRKRVSSKAHGL